MPLLNRPTLWCLCGAFYVLCMLWLSLSPSNTPPSGIPHLDKVLHSSAHFCLCAWFFPLNHQHLPSRVLVFSITLGVAIEILQGFVPGRQPDIWDLVANISGAFLAYLLMSGKPTALLKSLIYSSVR